MGDLKAMVVAGVGGLLCAHLHNHGGQTVWALAAAAGAGLAVGIVNGMLTVAARVPSAIATLAVALAAQWVIVRHMGIGSVGLDKPLFVISGGDEGTVSPMQVRTVAVAGVWLVLAVSAPFSLARRQEQNVSNSSRDVFMALCLGGLLAGLAGGMWLIDHSSAPAPTQIIGDLRAPAAAMLAGAWLLCGPMRFSFMMLAMPFALLLATLWRQDVWLFDSWPGQGQLLALIIMVAVANAAIVQASLKAAKIGARIITAASLAIGGVVIAACSSIPAQLAVQRALQVAGALCTAAALFLLFAWRKKSPNTISA